MVVQTILIVLLQSLILLAIQELPSCFIKVSNIYKRERERDTSAHDKVLKNIFYVCVII